MDTHQVTMIIALTALAFWRRDIFLYFLVSPVLVVAGLMWRADHSTNDGLVVSIAIIAIGIYCFILGIYNLITMKIKL